VTDLVFSPDGRRLVSSSEDQTGLVWDVTLPALGGAGGGRPTDKRLAEGWARLADLDAGRGYAGLAVPAAPGQAVPLLRANARLGEAARDQTLADATDGTQANVHGGDSLGIGAFRSRSGVRQQEDARVGELAGRCLADRNQVLQLGPFLRGQRNSVLVHCDAP